jgi:hypothetical protein
MSNIFDSLQQKAFGIISAQMGYDATWIPSQEGAQQTARVLFKDPTEMHELAGVEYNPLGFLMEYYADSFVGLFESVRSGNYEEVTVNGKRYLVRDVKTVADGRTYRAKLDEVS